MYDKKNVQIKCCTNKIPKVDHGLGIDTREVQRVFELSKEAWLKPCICMNTDLRKKANNDFEKFFFFVSRKLKKI